MFKIGKIAYPMTPLPDRSNDAPRNSGDEARHKRFWDIALIALFGLLIALPGVGIFLGFGKPFDPVYEGRNPAPSPQVELRRVGPISIPRVSSLRKFPARFEPYFKDRLAFRREAMHVYLWTRVHHPTIIPQEVSSGSPETPSSNTKVQNESAPVAVVGKEGWLYYAGGQSLDGYRRIRPFTFEQLENIRLDLEAKQKLLRSRGIKYLIAIAPDKGTIYPEYLPDFVRAKPDPSRLDQLIDHFRKYSSVECLDLRPDLFEAKKKHVVYFKTDTHWNPIGGQVACRTILEALKHPDAVKENLDRYELTVQPFGGDERALLGNVTPVENAVVLKPREVCRAKFLKDRSEWWTSESNVSSNPNAPRLTAVVIHDSFFFYVGPFFSEHFQEVRYLVHANLKNSLLSDDIIESMPTVVIQSVVERSLNGIE